MATVGATPMMNRGSTGCPSLRLIPVLQQGQIFLREERDIADALRGIANHSVQNLHKVSLKPFNSLCLKYIGAKLEVTFNALLPFLQHQHQIELGSVIGNLNRATGQITKDQFLRRNVL